mmetsp:Transcript_108310/g.316849  ORF Transcript_108310/g.316849 Transcript_108310/m.316849 type:complete len:365 (-) Transcript_108310:379-1473(-)
MQAAAWKSQGFDFATPMINLQKTPDFHEPCDCRSSKSSRLTGSGSGSVSPGSTERLYADHFDYATLTPLTVQSLPISAVAAVLQATATSPMAVSTPMATSMLTSVDSPKGAALPVMWSAWPCQQQPFQLVSVPAIPAPLDVQPMAGHKRVDADAATGPWWRLVWCHERCHKQESVPRRSLLSQLAAEAGASLVCLKKADKFAAWAAHAERPPFVLLTDWREAKPCLQALAPQPQHCRPLLTVILADDAKQFERASLWAGSLPESTGSVHVFPDVDMTKHFLQEQMASICRQHAAARSSGQGQENSLPMLRRPTADDALAAGSLSPPPALAEPAGTEILSPLRQRHTVLQLTELLKSAMPEHYDD